MLELGVEQVRRIHRDVWCEDKFYSGSFLQSGFAKEALHIVHYSLSLEKIFFRERDSQIF